ncbi:AraC-type DNA-binding protein [Solimonas aquatica]|uniref:AraC-type DNA-binding protein n=1 Tax=Solimonas aquatica TaxID=489703 RepID=A0A1H9HFP9_9GAMM|nr:AraC family transcriptional regulator [Solimonas aquatica]SEQ61181.1 AraC-type DNA-binding protein [Solimonas aquatica]
MSSLAPERAIPFVTLPNWVKAAALCGFNIQSVFDELGIHTDLLHLEQATIGSKLLEQVMARCVARSRQRHFPFVLGETFAFEYLPDIETFITTSPTLREAATAFRWVHELINPLIDVRVEEQGEWGRLVLYGAGSATPAQPYFVEALFASVLKFGRLLAPQLERSASLHLRYPPPPHVAVYAECFHLPLHFEAPFNALQLPRASLDAPRPGAIPSLHRQAGQRVAQRIAHLPRHSGLIALVEAQFEQEPHLLGVGILRMARRLNMNPRSLQRRLREEGQAYSELQDRVRYRLALRDLDDRALDLETIAERLGFSDRRSFTRAFLRWAGMTPSRYRAQGG